MVSRVSGLLLHPTSLPGPCGIGDLGPDAYRFLDFLDAAGQRVWQVLRAIPPGTTTSYTDIAERIGAPQAVRAVAQACASNALAVAIPCHRVVRKDGALAGYRWGLERKRALLDREVVS